MPARSEICPSCCPNGGAIFRRDMVWCDDAEDYLFHDKVCQNCGHVKKPRKRQARLLVDATKCSAEEAKAAKFNAKNTALFHYFNPNGAYAAWRAFDDLVGVAVDLGAAKSGFWIAYGTLGGDYHYKAISKYALQAKPSRRDVDYTVREIYRTIERGRAALIEKIAEHGYTLDDLQARVREETE